LYEFKLCSAGRFYYGYKLRPSFDFNNISFLFSDASVNQNAIPLRLKLTYNHDFWLPKLGGVKIDTVIDDDALEELRQRCRVFTHRRIDQALAEAFDAE
jgi:hypothetical protein